MQLWISFRLHFACFFTSPNNPICVCCCTLVSLKDHISNLSIHPEYGPWISFRAAVVFNVDFDDIDINSSKNCSLERLVAWSDVQRATLKKKVDEAIRNQDNWRYVRRFRLSLIFSQTFDKYIN